MEARILGPLEVLVEGRNVEIRGGKQRELLAVLIINAGEIVPTDRLIDELWGEAPPTSALKTLQALVSRLRTSLGTASRAIETRGHGYRLRLERGDIDADVFRKGLEDGRTALARGDAETASETLREALALWRGPALAEFRYQDFAQAEIARLDELRLAAQEEWIEAELALGRHDELIVELEGLVEKHPLRERARGELMLALYRAGRQAEALQTYQRGRHLLSEELGLDPSESLQRLQRQILEQDPALAPPVRQTDPPLIDAFEPKSVGDGPRRRAGSSTERTEPRILTTARRRAPLGALALGGAITVVAVMIAVWAATATSSSPEPVLVSANSVAVVDQEELGVTAATPTGARPVDVVLVGGSAWIANAEEGTVTQVDVESRRVVRTIGLGFEPTGLAGGDSAVWVVGGFDHQLSRIDASDGRIRLRLRFRERLGPLPSGFERGPAGVAVGGGGVWVSHGVELTRFDPRTGAVERTVRAGGPWVTPIAFGENRLWVAFDGRLTRGGTMVDAPALDVVDTTQGIREARVPLSAQATDVKVGAGYSWVALSVADAVWRIDPRRLTLDATMPAGDDPVSLSVDPTSVWVCNQSDATVRELDARSGTTLSLVPVGHTLEGVAAADGELWVAVRSP